MCHIENAISTYRQSSGTETSGHLAEDAAVKHPRWIRGEPKHTIHRCLCNINVSLIRRKCHTTWIRKCVETKGNEQLSRRVHCKHRPARMLQRSLTKWPTVSEIQHARLLREAKRVR